MEPGTTRDALATLERQLARIVIWGVGLTTAASIVAGLLGVSVFHVRWDQARIVSPSAHIGWPLLLVSVLPYVGLLRLARTANVGKDEGLASAAVGLAYGGQVWIAAVVLTLPASDAQALTWLRHHAWDYLAAGAFAAIVWHLLVSRQRVTRMATMQLMSMLVAAITSFTADDSNILSVSMMTLLGGILGIMSGLVYTRIAESPAQAAGARIVAADVRMPALAAGTPAPATPGGNRAERRRAQRDHRSSQDTRDSPQHGTAAEHDR
jgi:hypothetical protein